MSSSANPPPGDRQAVSYRDAGVDIDAGNSLIDRIRPAVERTRRPELLDGLGGFGALMRLPEGYREPVLVAGTDGVGTKLKLAQQLDRHGDIGVDLVGMCVNDVLVQGAEPLLFLDYFATGRLEVDRAAEVVAGIARGCELAGAALAGGETAEMPGLYQDADYDLAGFCVGVVERGRIIDGRRQVRAGDALVGLASSGPHSNGYSLIRHVLDRTPDWQQVELAGRPLADHLMAPTRIHVRAVLALLPPQPVHAIAHITGGGLTENLPRVLPLTLAARIDSDSWRRPAVFDWLQQAGPIEDTEMWRTFNCGVGLVLVLPAEGLPAALELLREQGETAWTMGEIVPRRDAPVEWS